MYFLLCLWTLTGMTPAARSVEDRVERSLAAQAWRLDGEFRRRMLFAQRRPPGPPPGPRHGRPFPPPPWLLERLKDLPPEEQEKVLQNNERFQQLPKERQKQILERLRRFRELTPEQRELIKQRFATFRNLTPEQREKAREIYREHWRTLSPERRQALIEEFRNLRGMSPEKRERRLARPELQRRFNPAERELLKELSAL